MLAVGHPLSELRVSSDGRRERSSPKVGGEYPAVTSSLKMEHSAKKARTSAAPSAASTGSYVDVDETHAVHLARHLADLYERSRFTDLRVRRRTTDCHAPKGPAIVPLDRTHLLQD